MYDIILIGRKKWVYKKYAMGQGMATSILTVLKNQILDPAGLAQLESANRQFIGWMELTFWFFSGGYTTLFMRMFQ